MERNHQIYPVMALACLIYLASAAFAQAQTSAWSGEGWETDFSQSSIDLSEIISGGPPRDGIPSIDNPRFESADAITDIDGREPVIQFPIEGDSRAYPLRVLIWHEIVNDVVDSVPVAVTYCPLCNAAIVFDRRLDGQTLEFGTTGKLRHSDLIMYDRTTQSWWQQFSGDAVVGALTGRDLKKMPSRIVSFEKFRQDNPSGQVLVPNDPNFRRYGDNPYQNYDTAERPFLFQGELPDDIAAMAHVVVVDTGAEPIIVSLERVRKSAYERNGYTVSYQDGVASALDAHSIEQGRDIGTVVVTKDGADIVHDLTFAFVAHVFYPDVPIIQ
ncbi:DUF3179 domain-containing protein [Devosia rhodophyticola]|uniref:DUF3179 domain-containing protein n=1 Tax=Devosia rhodophyticola TaxID=3026423 RepID=A0ABY7YZQ3_9HYPH|nr:DUF3179 domain-containing protein [Devosia rhodophyticola]WDR06369.1 DUF3179 domain-containing protein [Devosia rhodophyticola]